MNLSKLFLSIKVKYLDYSEVNELSQDIFTSCRVLKLKIKSK